MASSRGATNPPRQVVWSLQGIAAQAVFALHQVHLITLIRQGQGGGHAGHAAADHQGRLVDGHR